MDMLDAQEKSQHGKRITIIFEHIAHSAISRQTGSSNYLKTARKSDLKRVQQMGRPHIPIKFSYFFIACMAVNIYTGTGIWSCCV